jgi:shikimate kinase / 3-dehydroquinate synthase
VRTFLPAPPLPAGRPRLVVTGFMGTGKTSAGKGAAGLLGLPFLDLDAVTEARSGMTVSGIFAELGEPAFRKMEREVVESAARLSGTVVATGAGAVEDARSFGRLADGAVVSVLVCEPEELARRLGSGSDRPMLQPDPGARMQALLTRRAPMYAAAGTPLDTTALTADQVAHELAAAFREASPGGIVRIEVEGPDGTYPVVIGPGSLEAFGAEPEGLLSEAGRVGMAFDEAAAPVAERVAVSLERAGIEVACRIVLPPGESAKTADVVAAAWSRLREAGFGPRDALVAVGGGAALDAAGFAAATYARGIGLVNVPTTLLAMVDAALGGKVGIDHAGVKNLVGSFHHPRMVVADSSVLSTLPARELRAGLAEALKAMVLASPLSLDVLDATFPAGPEDRPEDVPALVDWIVEQAVRVKAAYVAGDPRDQGLRHALNLGHTFAHAIEAATDHAVLHGEAVAVGLLGAARLGARIDVTPPELAARLRDLLGRFGLPTVAPSGLDRDRLLDAMSVDKKRRGGRAVFVVPAPGGAVLVDDVSPEAALDCLLPHGAAEERTPR